MLWAALITASFLGGVVQTVTGFGAGVVIMMFLPYFFDLLAAPAINSTICLGVSATLAWKYRKKLKRDLYAIPLVIYACFGVLFVRLVRNFDVEWLSTAFSGFLILLALYSFLAPKGAAFKATPATAFLCSMISGICGALFGIGGPLMALYYSAVTQDREEYTANLQLIFALSSLLMTATRAMNGLYTASMLSFSVVGILSIRAGSWVGGRIADKIPAELFRKVVYLSVGVSGLIMLVQKLL